MATTSPARIDDDLYASAKLAGSVQSRSASQQVAHWARIGREIEASASISQREIVEVLAGSRAYDSLDPKEQAVVRAEWSARMDAARASLNLVAAFTKSGRTWVELDEGRRVVENTGKKAPSATKSRGAKPASATAAAKKKTKKATSVKAAAKKSRARSAT